MLKAKLVPVSISIWRCARDVLMTSAGTPKILKSGRLSFTLPFPLSLSLSLSPSICLLQGLFWSQACIWLIYPEKRIPHLKNEAMNTTSAYPFLYTDYLPTEFLINGIVSACLTVINVICIFITAIIVLKIKEVSAPYTASPDLKR